MMSMEEYLDRLTEQIRYKKARGAIRREVEGHLADQIEAYLEEGLEEEEAKAKAVLEMGDPVETGEELDRIHRPKMAWGTITAVGILGAAGLLLQNFLQNYFSEAVWTEIDFGKQFFYLALSFAAMLGVCWLDYSRIGRHAKALTLGLTLLLLISGRFLGMPVNYSQHWIRLPFGFGLNVSVAVFLFVPLYGAVLYSYRKQGYLALLKAVMWMIPPFLVIGLQGASVYTMFLLFLALAAVLFVAVWKDWFCISRKIGLFLTGGSVILFPAAGIWGVLHIVPSADPYLAARLGSYLTGEGYQVEMLRRIVENSKIVGAAYSGAQTWMGQVSGYTLTYAIAYYGILAGALLAGALLLLFLHFIRRSLRQKNQMGMLMGVGCSAVLLLQLVLYILENLGLAPTCGGYCPFLTYGGSGMVVTFVLIGLMLSIYRYEDVYPEENSTGRVKIYN